MEPGSVKTVKLTSTKCLRRERSFPEGRRKECPKLNQRRDSPPVVIPEENKTDEGSRVQKPSIPKCALSMNDPPRTSMFPIK